jgi:hypothetical protein
MSETTFHDAYVAALGEMTNPTKDATAKAGAFSYQWATLPQVLGMARPILARHGLALVFDQVLTEGHLSVSAIILHTSGDSMTFGPMTARAGADMQQVGSQASYLRRYLTLAALGVAADDDDDAASVKGRPVHVEPETDPWQSPLPPEHAPMPPGLRGPAAARYASSTETATAAQFGKIKGLCEERGVASKADQFTIVADLVLAQFGETLDSSKDLKKPQASYVITALGTLNADQLAEKLVQPALDEQAVQS